MPPPLIALASAFLLTASVLLAACGDRPTMPVTGPEGTPDVSFVIVQTSAVPLVTELPGRIAPTVVAEVRPQVTGLIQTRAFSEGTNIRAGQLLYEINPQAYRGAVDGAQASLSKAEANLEVAKLRSERLTELAEIKAASRQDADDAAAAVLQAQAEVAGARASLHTQRINLTNTRVTAPISGRIGRSTVTQGALVTANQAQALATVQKLDPVYVDMTQTSTQLLSLGQALSSGQLLAGSTKVRLLLENGTQYPADGRLRSSEVTVDQSTGAVMIRAEFPNPQGRLLPGMFVRAVVEEGVIPNALLVPQQAVARDASGQPLVHVIGADNKLERRAVQTGRAIRDQWLITGGLRAGERIAVAGHDKLPAGTAVLARPAAQAAPVHPASAAMTPASATSAERR